MNIDSCINKGEINLLIEDGKSKVKKGRVEIRFRCECNTVNSVDLELPGNRKPFPYTCECGRKYLINTKVTSPVSVNVGREEITSVKEKLYG